MSIYRIYLFFLFLSLPLNAASGDGWNYSIALETHSGSMWFNERGKKEEIDANLDIRKLNLLLEIPIYKKINISYSLSYLFIKGTSNFWVLYNDTLIPARTLQQKNHNLGDSRVTIILAGEKSKIFMAVLIPTGNSDFYPGTYPTGTGRWGISTGVEKEISYIFPLNLSTEIRYLFKHTYSYRDYLWNILYYPAPAKLKFFLTATTNINFSEVITISPGLKYYHEIALSKENILWGNLKIRLPVTKSEYAILSLTIPLYGKYYPSQPLPYFFWENQMPVGYILSLIWRGKW